MEISALKAKLTDFVKKYKFAILVLLIGIIFMTLPPVSNIQEHEKNDAVVPEKTVEERLEELLSNVQGAGEVKVMLTVGKGPYTFYQENQDLSEGQGSSSQQHNTVITTDSQRNEAGLIRQILSETYRGAVVLCRGADQPPVKLAIIEAVSRVTGLTSDRISVLKMK